jgi:type I restriction enzyme R subunit
LGVTPAITSGQPKHTQDEKERLSAIVETLNEAYGLNLTEEDKIDIGRIQEKVEADEGLQAVMNPHNSLDNIRIKFDKTIDGIILDFVNTKIDLYKKLSEPKANALFKAKLFDGYQQRLSQM